MYNQTPNPETNRTIALPFVTILRGDHGVAMHRQGIEEFVCGWGRVRHESFFFDSVRRYSEMGWWIPGIDEDAFIALPLSRDTTWLCS